MASVAVQRYFFERDEAEPASPKESSFEFSFCSLVNNLEQYRSMIGAFVRSGFSPENSEFLFVDNTKGNVGDGYTGLNSLTRATRGQYIIYCHQDVFPIDDYDVLIRRLRELDDLDPAWAIAGNAGFSSDNIPACRITDKFGADQRFGSFPMKVITLDENFFILKSDVRVSFSNDLQGFHLYATDLVSNARLAGWNAYVIDYHLRHDGNASMGEPFEQSCAAFQRKLSEFARPRKIVPPSTKIYIGNRHRAVRRLMHKFWL